MTLINNEQELKVTCGLDIGSSNITCAIGYINPVNKSILAFQLILQLPNFITELFHSGIISNTCLSLFLFKKYRDKAKAAQITTKYIFENGGGK